jgi:activator of 2-hydroxyglutaryl-CoA dehydratase
MNFSPEEFTRSTCLTKYPSDLGMRCTVFINSKVKQTLLENASPSDRAVDLAYSVVKNRLFKALKIIGLELLGERIAVYGGTFRNSAIYRAFKLLSGKPISSINRPEMIGAIRAALYARLIYEKHALLSAPLGNITIRDIKTI